MQHFCVSEYGNKFLTYKKCQWHCNKKSLANFLPIQLKILDRFCSNHLTLAAEYCSRFHLWVYLEGITSFKNTSQRLQEQMETHVGSIMHAHLTVKGLELHVHENKIAN